MKEELYLDILACGLLYDEVCVKPLGKEECLTLDQTNNIDCRSTK